MNTPGSISFIPPYIRQGLEDHYSDTGDKRKYELQKRSNERFVLMGSIATLEYSSNFWFSKNVKCTVKFYQDSAGTLSVEITPRESRKKMYTLFEKQIYQIGWFSSTSIENMSAKDKNALIQNLRNKRIYQITSASVSLY